MARELFERFIAEARERHGRRAGPCSMNEPLIDEEPFS